MNINRRYTNYLQPVISGVLSGIAMQYFLNWLAWFMLIPLFYSLMREPGRAFLKGAICGFVQGLILLSWMVSSVGRYTGNSSNIGFTLWIVSATYFALITALPVWLFTFFYKKNFQQKHAWWLNALLAGAVWVIVDSVRTRLSPGIPWLHFQFAVTQCMWVVPIQVASISGIGGLTFFIVRINVLFSQIAASKKYSRIWLPLSLYFLLIIIGVIRLVPEKNNKQKSIKVALICENMDARQRWQPNNGDSLATIFFDLNKQAAKLNPQLIVWSESALPWNLAMDDDLITQCLKITWPARANHIIGIFTPSEKEKDKRYNSAYYIESDGAITGRYDKMQLLSFLEAPFAGAKLPFFRQSMHTDLIPGIKRNILKTQYGSAGICICNESLVLPTYKESIKKGADFFVVMSNDAWFEGSRLGIHHFYDTRLRAVEFGKDMIINANRGVSGIISEKGVIRIMNAGHEPAVLSGTIHPKNHKTFYAKHGEWFVILMAIYLIVLEFYRAATKNRKI